MTRIILNIVILLFSIPSFSQSLSSNFSNVKLDKGKTYCDDLEFKTVDTRETFVYCKAVYTQKNNYRQALNVIEIAQKKFPYSYDVRLQKALALQDLGSSSYAQKELIGLLKLYPSKPDLHNYLARIQYGNDRVTSLMSFIMSVMLNPNDKETKENLIFAKRLLNTKPMSWEINSTKAQKLTCTGKNSFDLVHYELTHNTTGTSIKDDRDYLIERITVLAEALETTNHSKSGYFWDFYGEYFIELNKQDLVAAAVDMMLNNDNNPDAENLKELNSSFGIK